MNPFSDITYQEQDRLEELAYITMWARLEESARFAECYECR